MKEELLSVAYLALVESSERYDTEAGVPFLAFASYRVKGAIIQELNRLKGWKGVAPDRARLRLQLAYNAIRESDSSAKGLESVLNSTAKAAIAFGLSQSGSEADIADHVADSNSDSPEEALAKRELRSRVQSVMGVLSERDQYVISCYYFQDMNFEEIAIAIHKEGYTSGDEPVTRSWVCKIHARALKKMKVELTKVKS
jgi:RNA polymerase sigma factor for flagellar operon FliA